jgi:solute carrier family 25 (mitochondrial S-adenosylmethionine transporter), member 26
MIFVGFYAGYGATLVRDVPFTMLELGIYENIKAIVRRVRNRSTLTSQEELAAAAFTGGTVAFVTTPLDLIKTKLSMQSTSGGQYSGVIDALQSVYSEGGIKALFVGSTARVAWLLPFTTIYLGIYELSKRTIIAAKTKKAQK